jgi:hypothetical protein
MFTALALALISTDVRADDGDTFSVEVATSGMEGDKLDSGRMPYASIEGRSQLSGPWVGRGTIGVEVFPEWEGFDLELGLSLAGAGYWRDMAIYPYPGVGFEFGLGVNLGRLHGHYRSVTPFRDNDVGLVTQERRWRVGFDVVDRFQVFGEGLVLNEEAGVTEWDKARAFGLGGRLSF